MADSQSVRQKSRPCLLCNVLQCEIFWISCVRCFVSPVKTGYARWYERQAVKSKAVEGRMLPRQAGFAAALVLRFFSLKTMF